ncbi:28819_t:CDS:2, partial [Racocetra persica]
DVVNRRSNQMNIDVINSSNLCSEIIEYSNNEECAVCNLASINLPSFIIKEENKINGEEIKRVVRRLTKSLDILIDKNTYPIPQAEKSNKCHRPIRIGTSGYASLLCVIGIPFDSKKAKIIIQEVYEIIYFLVLETSMELAVERADWNKLIDKDLVSADFITRTFDWVKLQCSLNWTKLKGNIQLNGTHNSLLMTQMSTSTTLTILMVSNGIDPYYLNIFQLKNKGGGGAKNLMEFDPKLLTELLESNRTKKRTEGLSLEVNKFDLSKLVNKLGGEDNKTDLKIEDSSIFVQYIELDELIKESNGINTKVSFIRIDTRIHKVRTKERGSFITSQTIESFLNNKKYFTLTINNMFDKYKQYLVSKKKYVITLIGPRCSGLTHSKKIIRDYLELNGLVVSCLNDDELFDSMIQDSEIIQGETNIITKQYSVYKLYLNLYNYLVNERKPHADIIILERSCDDVNIWNAGLHILPVNYYRQDMQNQILIYIRSKIL